MLKDIAQSGWQSKRAISSGKSSVLWGECGDVMENHASYFLSFEFDYHRAAQLEVIEKQVDEEVVAASFQMYLPPHEGEAHTEFQQELCDVLDR